MLRLHGAYDPVSGQGVEQVMAVQLQYSYFPVREAELRGRVEYVTLSPDESVRIGSATITPCLLNHPVINYGYRIEARGKSVFFTGDHEPPTTSTSLVIRNTPSTSTTSRKRTQRSCVACGTWTC